MNQSIDYREFARRIRELNPEPPKAPRQWVVYVIEAGPFVKVGSSSRIAGRIETLQSGNPYELILRFKLKVAREHAISVERRAHIILEAHRKHGEWFECDHIWAARAVREAKFAICPPPRPC